jgi:hypothetical protein
MTDYLERSNDSLIYKIDTRSVSDYGNLRVNLQNVKQFPVLVELTDSKGDVVASEYSESNSMIEFNLIEPAVFSLRAIYDINKNKEWDTGDFLEKRQAEEVIYYSKEVDVRANWDVEQVFDLSIPYTPELKKKKVKSKKTNSGF